MGAIWLAGAIMQASIVQAGLGYPHGHVFTAIMALASLIFFLMPSVL